MKIVSEITGGFEEPLALGGRDWKSSALEASVKYMWPWRLRPECTHLDCNSQADTYSIQVRSSRFRYPGTSGMKLMSLGCTLLLMLQILHGLMYRNPRNSGGSIAFIGSCRISITNRSRSPSPKNQHFWYLPCVGP